MTGPTAAGGDAYQPRPGVRTLRDLTMADYADVPAALADPAFRFPAPAETAMVVSDGARTIELSLEAAFVWDSLDGARTIEMVAERVSRAFTIDRVTARRDVERLCAELAQLGLLVAAAVEVETDALTERQ